MIFLSSLRDQLLGCIIGLSKVCSMHTKTSQTDLLILSALADSKKPDITEDALQNTILQIKREKSRVAPMCEGCAAPCGNSDNYDMKRLWKAPKEIRRLKISILLGIQTMASYVICQSQEETFDEKIFFFFHKALFVLSEDWNEKQLYDVVLELGEYYEFLRNQ